MIAGVSIATCERVGLPRIAGCFMFNLLQQMKFHLITCFGQSSSYFCNNDNGVVGQGVLQGSSSTAPIYILNSNVCLSAYKKHSIGASFNHPITKEVITDSAVQYVDDTSQFVNGNNRHTDDTPHNNLISMAKANSQTWANLLWVSGGNLNLGKCYYYAFQPRLNYKKNKIIYEDLDKDSSIVVMNPADNHTHEIRRTHPSIAQRTLGAKIALNGDGSQQLQHTLRLTREFFGKFKSSNLSNQAKWVAITSTIEPAIIYPLVNIFYRPNQLYNIDSCISQMKCMALGLNRNFPHAILHGPTLLGGLGIPSTRQKNTIEHLLYFLYNVRRDSPNCQKYEMTIVYTQIEVGTFSQFFSLPFDDYGHLPSIASCVQLWSEIQPNGLILQPLCSHSWTPAPLGNGEIAIMQIAVAHYNKKGSAIINKCRPFLQVFSLYDLLIYNSNIIHPSYMRGELVPSRTSIISWPSITKPPKHYWSLWSHFTYKVLTPILERTQVQWGECTSYRFTPSFYKYKNSFHLYQLVDNTLSEFHLMRGARSRFQASYNHVPYQCRVSFNEDEFVPDDVQYTKKRYINL